MEQLLDSQVEELVLLCSWLTLSTPESFAEDLNIPSQPNKKNVKACNLKLCTLPVQSRKKNEFELITTHT